MTDFEPFAAHHADEEASRFLGGVCDRREAYRRFASASGSWVLNRAGWWAIELQPSQELTGMVGAFFRETSFDADDRDPSQRDRVGSADLEVGWSVFRQHWRNGYASEAAKAALEHAVHVHAPRRVTAYISEGNVASVRVAEHLGMRFDKVVPFYGVDPVMRFVLFPTQR